jgi:NAD(P)-dependent dehydrogenase (short-subunit alcohol dehydrogenase family)
MNRVRDRIALVTGAATGIGRSTALALAREGAAVCVTDVAAAGAEAVAAEARALGVRAIAARLDVTQESDWQSVLARIATELGPLDVLVNNAGVPGPPSLLETTLAQWRETLAVNLDGVFLGTKHGIEAMRALPDRPRTRTASIVNVCSVLGLVGFPSSSAYAASKGGVRSFTKTAAIEAAANGWQVRVNTVHPGFVETPMLTAGLPELARKSGTTPEAIRAAIEAMHPLGRLASPDEVANTIVYLASDESAFVTGTELVIDGGYTAR